MPGKLHVSDMGDREGSQATGFDDPYGLEEAAGDKSQ